MHKLFTEGLRNEPQKQTEIGLVPESWEVVRCEDVCDTISVGIVVKPSSYYVAKGVPAFRSQNVREDRIQSEPMVYISEEANNGPVKKSKLSAGDVLIVRTGYSGTREDVVFLINGIPVLVIECKNANKDEAIALGVDQIRRYHRETPELFVSQQLFTATDAIGFSYGVTWNTVRRNIFNWKLSEGGFSNPPYQADSKLPKNGFSNPPHQIQKGGLESPPSYNLPSFNPPSVDIPGRLEAKVKTFCAIPQLLAFLKDYIVFAEKDEELNKYILRQRQTGAVEKAVGRALDPGRTRGLIWHTQGSGKTFTMIKTAEKLFRAPDWRSRRAYRSGR